MNPNLSGKIDVSSKPQSEANPFSLVAEEINSVDKMLNRELASEASLILDVSRYVFSSGGKRFRPAVHLLSAKLLGFEDPIRIQVAAALECIHTASLLHDDVVDGATLRRGKPAANTVWDDHTSVLVGDFLLTTSVKWILEADNMPLIKSAANICTRMAEGEAYQLKIAKTRLLSEEDYLKVVAHKTAGLISLCCHSAAMLAQTDDQQFESLNTFGHGVGMAFQIVDDALDYCSETSELGKAIGKDLEEGKITLPMLHALDKASAEDRKTLETILSSPHLGSADLPKAQELIRKYDGVDFALDRANKIIEESKQALLIFDKSPARDALMQLADFTVSRSK